MLAKESNLSIKQLQARTLRLEQELAALKKQSKTSLPDAPIKTKGAQDDVFTSTPLSIHVPKKKPQSITFNPSALMVGEDVLTYIVGMPVVSSPYLGKRPAFDGSDFITNISSINQDVRLMMQRMILSKQLASQGYPAPNLPILALSGAIESLAHHSKSYQSVSDWDLDLSTAELDVSAGLNAWVVGYLSFAYDASAPTSGGRVSNANVYLSKGFLNIGNLEKSPVYLTTGQFYLPFGRFSSSMISAPLTAKMGKTIARAAELGFHHQRDLGAFGALYAFKSETTNASSAAYGVNWGYNLMQADKRAEVGLSYISAINAASGMQSVAASTGEFSGFTHNATSRAVDSVPAIDLHANFSMNAWGVAAEWISATQSFRSMDLSFNQTGAKPQALNVEAAHTFKIKNKALSVALGYGWSEEALALKLPKQRFSAVASVSLWRDTVESIEVRHDVDYAMNAQAAGAGSSINTLGTGKSSNTVTAQLGIYF